VSERAKGERYLYRRGDGNPTNGEYTGQNFLPQDLALIDNSVYFHCGFDVVSKNSLCNNHTPFRLDTLGCCL
jgi:hypothetical protein